jgi:hypothetical protein
VAINSSHLKRVQRALREPDDRRLPGAEAERRPPVGGARWEKKVEQAWRSQLHLEASTLAKGKPRLDTWRSSRCMRKFGWVGSIPMIIFKHLGPRL